jgi:antirestriction protein ArdC
MTCKQAQEHGYQVRKGEKGTSVEYWLFPSEEEKKKGVIVRGERVIPQPRPQVFYATVFNAEQIDGVPTAETKPLPWNPVERAEEILRDSGARIFHTQYNHAFYNPLTDNIHLPRREQFKDAEAYYSIALHELGHWTGHDRRLNRPLDVNRRSPEYAKEELRAEIASVMMCGETGIAHDPTRHTAYVKFWIKALQDDSREIFRAAAEKIQSYLLGLSQRERPAETMNNPLAMPF